MAILRGIFGHGGAAVSCLLWCGYRSRRLTDETTASETQRRCHLFVVNAGGEDQGRTGLHWNGSTYHSNAAYFGWGLSFERSLRE
jgi:hypothetical protein